MKTYLEYKDEKSHKFWEIEVKENTFTVTYGKVDSKGQVRLVEFSSNERALLQAEKIIKQRINKGYKETEKKVVKKYTTKENKMLRDTIKDKVYFEEQISQLKKLNKKTIEELENNKIKEEQISVCNQLIFDFCHRIVFLQLFIRRQ